MKNTVITISDAHSVHCLTEDHIDEWWRSLPVKRKVDLFEQELEQRPVQAMDAWPTDRVTLDAASAQFIKEKFLTPADDVLRSMRQIAGKEIDATV